ncbi:MAG: hypothetical protein PHW43_05925, partial [Syntrophales bacterium]|nr:hypothetical protein [Syntrophales bacterium]
VTGAPLREERRRKDLLMRRPEPGPTRAPKISGKPLDYLSNRPSRPDPNQKKIYLQPKIPAIIFYRVQIIASNIIRPPEIKKRYPDLSKSFAETGPERLPYD